MRATLVRRRSRTGILGVQGPARIDRSTKRVVGRVRPGDIAVIDHVDLDRASAEALLARGVAGVVNISQSISGRYPNLGPEVLAAAGVPLLDAVGEDVLRNVREGQAVRLDGDVLYLDEVPVAAGRAHSLETVMADMEGARKGLAVQLEAFAGDATEFLRQERDLLLEGVGVPDIRTRIEGRPVLVAVGNSECPADLRVLKPFLRKYRPVLIGVDTGADALLAAGHAPDLIVGDLEGVSDEVLHCGAEIVVKSDRAGRGQGPERLERADLVGNVFASTGTSEDLALLLAEAGGASLVVTAGSCASVVEFLDHGRAGMASTFLTRLRLGGKLVDASAVTQLHPRRMPGLLRTLFTGVVGFLLALVLVGAVLLFDPGLARAVSASVAGAGRWLTELPGLPARSALSGVSGSLSQLVDLVSTSAHSVLQWVRDGVA